jgi:molybdopterin-guanine dinucleotide biosynthesis protein B
VAAYRALDRELGLDEIVAGIRDVDVILVEGYRDAGAPHVEVVRGENSRDLVGSVASRIAVVTDIPVQVAVPVFGLDDVAGVCRFIENRVPSRSPNGAEA